MADNKPTVNRYINLGGINKKASQYSLDQTQFEDIRNMDFQVPNALQKRPGSTQAISAGTSGPITSLFEFERLTGQSYIIAGSDTAMFLASTSGLTLLSPGWNNGQPTDMLTFVNKLWMANGQKYQWWTGETLSQVGLPCPITSNSQNGSKGGGFGGSYWSMGGHTVIPNAGGFSYVIWGLWVAYSYVRYDGYEGPLDFYSAAKNVVRAGYVPTGEDYFTSSGDARLHGFSVPSGYGITAVNIYVALDVAKYPGVTSLNGFGNIETTINLNMLTETLSPTADLSRFYLFTSVPSSSLFYAPNLNGITSLSTTFEPLFLDYGGMTGINGNPPQLMGVCWFNTNTPKYIEQNQNVMFMSGFSNTPSTVWFTNVGEPESIEADYNFEVRTNDGDLITGQKAYNNTVVVTKGRSFSKIIGSTPEDLQLVEMSQEYGCLSNKTMIQFKEKLLWLDRQGILEYNGSSWNIISTPVEPIFRRMNLNAASKAVAVNHVFRNQVWIGIPIDGSSENNLTVVYDYLIGAWTFFDGFNPASFALIKGSLPQGTVWRGDYSGLIHYFGESMYSDNGQGITCLATPLFNKLKENETNIWRRVFLDVASTSGSLTGTITGRVFSDYNLSTVQATFSMPQNVFQSRAEMGVVGKAVTCEFAHYSASLPLLINGYSWATRYLRNV